MSAEVKIIATLIGTILLIVGCALGIRMIYDTGKTAGMAQVQTAWDVDKAAISAATDKAIAAETKQREDALNANEAIQHDYQTQLAAANAAALQFAIRLRDKAGSTADRSPVSKAGGGQGSTATVPTTGPDRLTELLSAAVAECVGNEDRYDALVSELGPQL